MIARLAWQVRWQPHGVEDCTVLAPEGRMTRQNYSQFRDDLVRFAVDRPRAVIVSVDRVQAAWPPLCSALSAARMRVRTWPGVPIMPVCVSLPRRMQLNGSAVGPMLPVFGSVATALGSVVPPRPCRRVSVEVVGRGSAARARRCVDEAFRRWSMTACGRRLWMSVCGDAQLVATELVENALAHAGGRIRLHVEWRDDSLTVAVADGEPREAILSERGGDLRAGNGLHVVARLATAWGSVPRWPAGKVVWATMSTRNVCGVGLPTPVS